MSAVIRLAAAVVRGVCGEDGPEAEAMRELALGARREHDAAIAERDRLRRELEALRARLLADMPGNWDAAAGDCCPDCYAGWDAAIEGIGAILRGES